MVPLNSKQEAIIWLGELAIIHTDGTQTDNRYSLIELYATKEGEVPWHIHHSEDEAFYILDGEMSIYVGTEIYKAKAGDFVFAPKDVPHKYTVDSAGYARVLMFFSPAGFENFARETSIPAQSLTPPPPAPIEMDFEELIKIASEYGAEFVDPPENRNS
ncbi:MAG TPA: cupin domain-containing protein [Flavisolibacter sp.]|nr:cupin domain-containing protein [Flavisolibacter sp.]